MSDRWPYTDSAELNRQAGLTAPFAATASDDDPDGLTDDGDGDGDGERVALPPVNELPIPRINEMADPEMLFSRSPLGRFRAGLRRQGWAIAEDGQAFPRGPDGPCLWLPDEVEPISLVGLEVAARRIGPCGLVELVAAPYYFYGSLTLAYLEDLNGLVGLPIDAVLAGRLLAALADHGGALIAESSQITLVIGMTGAVPPEFAPGMVQVVPALLSRSRSVLRACGIDVANATAIAVERIGPALPRRL